ncbi:cytochrome b5-like [Lotus japonicus]|uniref:Cytochrome b5 heme-binding domain-containing protein n=1 Tax=Lotus japonicus TaxID=34305 RepID=I3S6M8_LOTJA|nr:cytochrome b5-like [Lotus japonicus]AFK35920.1 unknown [Lotus japonicus]AFK35978.1 unknown [Lotus japonicus]
MAERRVFTLSQVAQHKSNKDCWVVINGRVLDVTKFLIEHPGGDDVLLEVAGKDVTKEFDAVGHSKEAQNLVLKYQVGILQGATVQEIDVVHKEPNSKQEMSAFVIKEDAESKSVALFEFFVPLVVATLYFGYRCLTRTDPVTY